MNKINDRINSLNFFKAVACIGIVLIHCKFPGEFGGIIKTIARFAVPFFFMISGFFALYGENNEYNKEKMKRKIKHIAIITLCAVLFYLIFHLIFYCIIQGKGIIDEFNNYVSIDGIAKFLIQNSTFCYSHLWFLFALLYCYFFTIILKTKIKGNWKKWYVIIALAIFIITSEILPIFKINIELLFGIKIYNICFIRALPFYLLGMLLKENKTKILNKPIIANKVLIPTIGISFALSVVERFLSKDANFYAGTILAVISIFILCLKNQKSINRHVEYVGENLSLFIYIIHIAVYRVIAYILEYCNLSNNTIINWLKPILVIAISISLAFFIDFIKRKKMKNK